VYFGGGPDGHVRLGGTFRKPILGIMLAWLCFPVFVHYLVSGKTASLKNPESLFFLLVPFMVFTVITLSGERLALLLVLLGWVVAFFFMPRYRVRIILCVIVGLVAVFGTAAIDPSVLKRQGGSTLHTLTNWWQSPYGMLLKTDLNMAKINPVFGVGSYQFRILCPTLYPGMDEKALKDVCNIHPHNIYLEWLIENGIIGLGLFITFLGILTGICYRHWQRVRTDPMFIGFLIAFLLRMWPIASTTGLYSRWGASPLWLVLGCLLACTVIEEKEKL
jgi:O-antigen ligase